MSVILIRADGGPTIGFGHVTRCRALARTLHELGRQVLWITRTPDVLPADVKALCEIVSVTQTDEFEALSTLARRHEAPVLIGDWKDTDPILVQRLRGTGLPVALLGNQTGAARADLIVKQRFVPQPETRGVHYLDGPEHLLLPAAFSALTPPVAVTQAQSVFVSLGGSQSELIDHCLALCEELCRQRNLEVDILRPDSRGTPHRAQDVAERMRAADFAVMAGGTSLHEAAACRLPAICLPIVPHQLDRARSWEALGFGVSIVPDTPHWESQFATAFNRFHTDVEIRQGAIEKMAASVDGLGAQRVAQFIHTTWPGEPSPPESS
ncbi:hypothetical protein [Maricaulis sp.]|uniref:hypothetical protein n=1 Tax=Maricaulis sp. TaxID=1486257 RepID=UPI001B2A4056|nr:hypothetical protein [Maricaulis sp.]MBO6796790.1 hypothetical protein [Maricaulis sp.]